MCLLIHHTPRTKLTRPMLANFLKHNPDGFGFTSFDGKKFHCLKLPVADLKDIALLYDNYIRGREAVIHFRWRTHGEINRENTHPYKVVDGLWMAHNGVLNCVSQRDKSMSDTWHLVEDVLKPMLAVNRDLIFVESFQKMLGGMIGGSNKLGFMDDRGRVAIVNRAAGMEHAGAWYSNTYAWDPELFVEGYKAPAYGRWTAWDDYEAAYAVGPGGKVTMTGKPKSGNVAVKAKKPVNGNVIAAPGTLTKKQKRLLKKQRREQAILKVTATPARSVKEVVAPAAGSFREDANGRVWVGNTWADKSHLRSSFRDPSYRKEVHSSGPPLDFADSRTDGVDATERLLAKHDVQ